VTAKAGLEKRKEDGKNSSLGRSGYNWVHLCPLACSIKPRQPHQSDGFKYCSFSPDFYPFPKMGAVPSFFAP